MFSKIWTKKSTGDYSEGIGRLKKAVNEADAVGIGAGAGLSASAGLTYSGERIRRHEGMHILFLELGVGGNTPVIIKYPFWQMAASNAKAVYACVNYGEATCPKEIEKRSICLNGDIGEVVCTIVQ